MNVDLAIVGAGPAGLAAAQAAHAHGLTIAVIDEQQRPGGQIFRRPPAEFYATDDLAHTPYRWAPELLRWADDETGVRWQFGTSVLGVLPDPDASARLRLVLDANGHSDSLAADRLLIATGAYDLPVAMPGWTLPGVMAVGGAQSMLKSQRVLAGQRVVLAGSHPLLVLAADQFVAAGASVAEVAFARRLPRLGEAFGASKGLPGHSALLREAVAALRRLRRAGVRVRHGQLLTSVLGDERAEAAEFAAVDSRWRVTGGRRTVPADLVLVGFGFAPRTDLARQLRCELVWDSAKGGWVVTHDALMRTSIDRVYVAGEPGGVAGAETAHAEGIMAGLAVVQDSRGTSGNVRAELRAARGRLRRAERFALVVQRLFEPDRRALLDLIAPGTEVCRCELVTRSELDEVLDSGFVTSANGLKLYSRAGMGPCQGRYCESTVSGLVERASGFDRGRVGYYAAQLPVRPVPARCLASFETVPLGDAESAAQASPNA